MHVSIASNNPKEFVNRPLSEWMSYLAPIKSLEYPFMLERNAGSHDIVVFPAVLLMHLSLDSWPLFIEYKLITKQNSQAAASLTAQGNNQILSRIVGASFTNYYASCESTIKAKYGTVADKWPETIRFAWVIRNGFAHGGKLKISDPGLRSVTWEIWSFNHQHNGQKFLLEPGMLGIGDVIALMQEIDTYR